MTKRCTFRAATLGLTVSALLALSACGGDDDSSDTTAAASTEQTGATTGTGTGSSATTVAGGSATTAPGASAATTGAATPADCRALAEEFASALGAGTNPTADPAEIADAFNRLADNVPADLRDDVELVGEALGTYAEVYATVGGDPATAATDPDVLAAFQELATPEYAAATQAVSTYFTTTCRPGG